MTITYFNRKTLHELWAVNWRAEVRWSLVRVIRAKLEAYGADRDSAERQVRGIMSATLGFMAGYTPASEDSKLKAKLKKVADALDLIANLDANADRLIRRQLLGDDAADLRPLTLDFIEERPPLNELVATANIPAYQNMIEGAQRVHARVRELANAYRGKPGRKRDEARSAFYRDLIYCWKVATHQWPVDWEADTFADDADARTDIRPARATAPIFRIARLLVAEIAARTGKAAPSEMSSKAFSMALREMKESEFGPFGPAVPTPRKRGRKPKKDETGKRSKKRK